MTAEEKAKELVSTYRFALSIPNAPLGEYKDQIAKQCALIAVNEILKSLEEYDDYTEEDIQKYFPNFSSFQKQNMDWYFRYWEIVKTEIVK